ncbi:MAG: peptide deformylase [Clostridia bacterium]|nr:peptide deformylase [Clostridia bacterium]
MSIRKILTLPDPALREKSLPVKKITANVCKLLDDMAETMYDAPGVGLAAPQIGVLKRVIVVDVGEGLVELINPEIIAATGCEVDVEGCLSVPGLQGEVPRAAAVTVQGLDRHGKKIEIKATGLFARALQHETDHLDGIMFIDKVVRWLEPKQEEQ